MLMHDVFVVANLLVYNCMLMQVQQTNSMKYLVAYPKYVKLPNNSV